jgi:hypothetical protein
MIDEFEAGKLVAHVDKCNESIARLGVAVDELEVKIELLEKYLARGKGWFAGILLAVGAIGTAFSINWSSLPWGK